MTFDARESHRLNGRPFHLYAIRFGPEPQSVRYYTNLTTEFAFGADDAGDPIIYQPWPIAHGEIVSSGNLDKTTLDVRLPDEGDIPDLYRDDTPSSVVTVIIRQGHVGDDDFKVAWAGKTVGHSFEGSEMVLACEPITSSLRRAGLTRDYQVSCPLVLYGNQCRANRTRATIQRQILAVDGAIITLSPAWETDDARKDSYLGGIAEWLDASGRRARRSIVRRDGPDKLILGSGAPSLVAGVMLDLVLGCNHTEEDCRGLHDNILNYGGQPQIPTKSPFGIVNNYY